MYGDPLNNLDLSGYTAKEGAAILQPGRYVAVVKSAKFNTTADQRRFEVLLEDIGGAGVITARLSLFAQNADAQRIAREQLKALGEFGGHPNPDKPFLAGPDTFIGLAVGVTVGMGKPYKDKTTGVERTSPEVKGFFKLDDEQKKAAAPHMKKKSSGPGGLPLNDDIPFAPCM